LLSHSLKLSNGNLIVEVLDYSGLPYFLDQSIGIDFLDQSIGIDVMDVGVGVAIFWINR